VIDQYVSCIIEGEMAEGDVWLHALPLYHCAQLDVFLGPAVYLGATSIITAKPTPDNLLPHAGAAPASAGFFAAAHGVDRAAALAAVRASTTWQLRKGYYGASIMPVAVMRELIERLPQHPASGTSTARPRSPRWPPC
jgi:fatty-acyl-CoA synthase